MEVWAVQTSGKYLVLDRLGSADVALQVAWYQLHRINVASIEPGPMGRIEAAVLKMLILRFLSYIHQSHLN